MRRPIVILGALLLLGCCGIGAEPPPPDILGANDAFGCDELGSLEQQDACALLVAFNTGSRPEFSPTGELYDTGYEIWVGPSFKAGPELSRRYMSSHRKQYIDANTPYMSFREVWPDDETERAELEELIEASREGVKVEEPHRAAIYLRRLENTSDFLRLMQKTDRSVYLKPPTHSGYGDGDSADILAWVRQEGDRLILLEQGPPDHTRISELLLVIQ